MSKTFSKTKLRLNGDLPRRKTPAPRAESTPDADAILFDVSAEPLFPNEADISKASTKENNDREL